MVPARGPMTLSTCVLRTSGIVTKQSLKSVTSFTSELLTSCTSPGCSGQIVAMRRDLELAEGSTQPRDQRRRSSFTPLLLCSDQIKSKCAHVKQLETNQTYRALLTILNVSLLDALIVNASPLAP